MGIVNASKTCAFMQDSFSVLPDHVQFVFSSVAEHRLDNGNNIGESFSEKIMRNVDAIR